MKATDILIKSRNAISTSEARRLIVQGGLKVNGKVIALGEDVGINGGDKVEIGKKEFIWDDGTIWLDQ